jgi:hypothetical protein
VTARNAFLAGALLGLTPWLVHRLDRYLREPWNDSGPIEEWWRTQTWKQRRWVTDLPEKAGGWIVARPPAHPILATRRFRVEYECHCIHGPEFGWAPYKVGESWHWTLKGAEFKRRHRPPRRTYMRAVGLGSGLMVTKIDRRTASGWLPQGEPRD